VDPAFLYEVRQPNRNISAARLARALKMHPKVLQRKLREIGLQRRFDTLSNEQLDEVVRQFKQEKPTSGLRYAMGYLRSKSIKVQINRVRKALQRVDQLGHVLRRRSMLLRKPYSVPRPNHLWHCDGHHKLIQWGIVIHGFIDGYDRVVSVPYHHASKVVRLISHM
jgi:hypothetical protein